MFKRYADREFTFFLCLCALFSTGLVSGCVSTPKPYVPKKVSVSEPPLNSVNTVSVGENLLSQAKFSEHDMIQLLSPIGVSVFVIQPGTYIKTGETDDVEFYLPGGTSPGRIDKSRIADDWKNIIIKKEIPKKLCVLLSYNTAITTCTSDFNVSAFRGRVYEMNDFQQTLVYNGRVGKKINIGYREVFNSMVRPNFSNSVEYDLTDSNVIAYKGALLEIIEATNQKITYKTIKNFLPAFE